MSLDTQKTIKYSEAEELYLSAAGDRPAIAPWLDTLRKDAGQDFAAHGLPHRRIEAWKYTDLRAIDRGGFAPAEPGSGPVTPLGLDVDEIIIRNGFLVEDTLRPERFKGFKLMSLRTALTEVPQLLEPTLGDPRVLEKGSIHDLNLLLMNDGFVLVADACASHDRPILVRYINESDRPTSAHVRNVVIAREGARLTLIESREAGTSSDFLNVVTHIDVGNSSDVRHYRYDICDDESLTIMLASTELGAEARYENIGLSLGGKISRIETQVRFSGEGSHARLGGILAGEGKDHIDHTTIVRHDVPNCSCEEEFRAILTDRSQGVFQGQISVAPDAQKTDSRMMMRGLLLSENASMRAKPELEIYADDVKCAHGTSVGNIDEDALFYMMSRGIPEAEARSLLVEAFAGDVVEFITEEAIRSEFERQLSLRLAKIIRHKPGKASQ